MYKLVGENTPMNILLRTHIGDEMCTQKAILRQDGWFYPDGVEKLPWTPLYWIII